MKRFLLVCLFTTFFLHAHDPALVVVLMVKNEEAAIVPTLDPFIQAGIDAYLIFDTGSTDATIAKITAHFTACGITRYVIEQESFVDFATSRNRALDLADYHFPYAGFYIMPDAEWYIHGAKEMLSFCQKQILVDNQHPLYAIKIGNQNHEFDTLRLFYAPARIRFTGVVHEAPVCETLPIRVSPEIYFDWRPSQEGNVRTLSRANRDIQLLLKEYVKHPTDARTLFYLAQSYCVIGDYERSLFYYTMRSKLEGFAEETFIALYRAAQITEQLMFENKATWDAAEDLYLRAYAFRPSRGEPLIHLANHFLHNQRPELAYVFAKQAVAQGYPQHDSLHINKELYGYDMHAILAKAAWQLHDRSCAHENARIALRFKDDVELQTIIEVCSQIQ